MKRAMDRLSGGLMTVLGVLLLAMVVLSCWNVVSRYVFNRAILWADEVAVFAMIVLTFLGVIATTWRGIEIRMDVLVRMLPEHVQRTVRILEQAAIAALCFWVAWLSWGYVHRVFRVGMLSDGARLPLWIVHVMLPISFAALGLIACWRCVEAVRGRARVRGEELSL